jgi:hypothetical protein
MSASFALSFFFFSRRRGVAPAVFAKLTAAVLCCCQGVRLWEMTEKPAHCGEEAITDGLGQCRVGVLRRARDRW